MVIVQRSGFGCFGRGCGGFGALRPPTDAEMKSVRRMFAEKDFQAFACNPEPAEVDWGPFLEAEANRRGTSLFALYQRCDPTLTLADAKARADDALTAAERELAEDKAEADEAEAQQKAEEEERRRAAALLAAKPAGLPGWVVPVGILALAGIGIAVLAMRRSA